jgi:cyclopropane fatty-acyl-phospholipid synthase-like methyltransferase
MPTVIGFLNLEFGNQKMGKKNKPSSPTMAELADRHICYEEAVQCVEAEVDIIDSLFKKLRGRKASKLREDFCATANTSCEWVKRRDTNTAICFDIDQEVLDWSQKNKIEKLSTEQSSRIKLIKENVLDAKNDPVDIVLAMNFSYWVFKERKLMIKYFKKIRDTLVDDGIFFSDAYGGYEAFQELKEKTKNDGFTYIWDQHKYDPITGSAVNYIHFKFKDGSKIKKAFTYEWRVWTLPEILEMLAEAGFKPTVYWEQADEDGEGNGEFLPQTEGEADAGWIAYIVSQK